MAKFLLVDDAKFMQSLTEKLINKLGHEIVFKASNGIEALDYYNIHWSEIDVVLLDVVMPKFDGLQTLRAMKNVNPNVKIIMVTSISTSRIVQGALKAGASEFITKPFRLSEFVKAINKVISL